ncbi:hypothetical protein [Legionella hackeliae]|uniref:Uncharacterized protein n=1 Tax=Legionella hackeliae TaxID=449 RepID=A0A0A8UP09_LEGHA|nr:hypothetical protein [Legionella hackeliae]CEK10580.1 protein of unknown function [Legionella hackeliae]
MDSNPLDTKTVPECAAIVEALNDSNITHLNLGGIFLLDHAVTQLLAVMSSLKYPGLGHLDLTDNKLYE